MNSTTVHHQELDLLLSLYEKATINKVEVLILKGEALRAEKKDGPKEVFEEARKVLKELEDSSKQTALMAKVDELLQY